MQKYNHFIENEFIEELGEKNRKEEEIESNPRYINWLESFTRKYPRFTDDEFLDKKKKKTPEDIEGIKNLNLLYQVIDRYAEKNYLYSLKDSAYSEKYRIKYHNVGYEIGIMIGQGTIFFCNRIDILDETFIDFEDILLNKKQPHTNEINKILEELETIIASYYEQGVPLLAIKRSINEIFRTIQKQENKTEKKLVKNYEYKNL